MEANIKGSVAIVNWNSREYLRACLNSLRKQPDAEAWRVVVVDNGSSDGSAEMVRSEFQFVMLVANRGNAGFAFGNNQAFSHAVGRYFLLLNPDTEVKEGALAALAAFLDQHPEAGAVAPLLLNPDGSVQRYYNRFPSLAVMAMLLPSVRPVAERFGPVRRYFMEDDDLGVVREVDQPAASCLMLRRSLYDRIGMMDPAFPLYFNDVDLCRRIWSTGAAILLVPRARVVHHGGRGSLNAPDSFVDYWTGAFAYFRKHHGRWHEAVLRSAFLGDTVVECIGGALQTLVGKEGRGAAWYRARRAVRALRGQRLSRYELG